jgi:hypothetical protein
VSLSALSRPEYHFGGHRTSDCILVIEECQVTVRHCLKMESSVKCEEKFDVRLRMQVGRSEGGHPFWDSG